MEHRREEIKEYFKNWVIDRGSHHLEILKFLKYHKDLSDTNTKDNAWLDTYDLVHQEAFPTTHPIIENPTSAKAFLGSVKISIKAVSSNSSNVAMTGNRPTSSGIIPNFVKSIGSTSLKRIPSPF